MVVDTAVVAAGTARAIESNRIRMLFSLTYGSYRIRGICLRFGTHLCMFAWKMFTMFASCFGYQSLRLYIPHIFS